MRFCAVTFVYMYLYGYIEPFASSMDSKVISRLLALAKALHTVSNSQVKQSFAPYSQDGELPNEREDSRRDLLWAQVLFR